MYLTPVKSEDGSLYGPNCGHYEQVLMDENKTAILLLRAVKIADGRFVSVVRYASGRGQKVGDTHCEEYAFESYAEALDRAKSIAKQFLTAW